MKMLQLLKLVKKTQDEQPNLGSALSQEKKQVISKDPPTQEKKIEAKPIAPATASVCSAEEYSEIVNLDVRKIAMEKVRDARRLSLPPVKGDHPDDIFVEETILFLKESESASPVPLLLALNEGEGPNYKAISDDVLKKIKGQAQRRSGVLDLSEDLLLDQSSQDLEGLVQKMQAQKNELQELILRRPSILDAEMEKLSEQKESFKTWLQGLELTWIEDPQSKSFLEKRKFLTEFVEVAEVLGVHDTVDLVLPNLINVFNSDEVEELEPYTKYMEMLFGNLGRLIDFLGKEGATSREKELSQKWAQEDTPEEPPEGEYTGYQGLQEVLLEEIFAPIFQPQRWDSDTLEQFQDRIIDQFKQLTEYLTPEDRTEKVVPIILEAIQDQENDDRRALAVVLLDAVSPLLGEEVVLHQLLYEYVSLQDDPIFKIRRELLSRLINLTGLVNEQVLHGVFVPVYRKLSTDSIWSVRKACVENLTKVASACDEETRHSQVVQILERLAEDQSKWVRIAAFQQIGPFISEFDHFPADHPLIRLYSSLGLEVEDPSAITMDDVNPEIAFQCAFNFPAVLRVLGPDAWDSQLRPLHSLLAGDSSQTVRRSLAFSLHEVAQIVGPDRTASDLFPILLKLLKDSPRVAEGALQNLSYLLRTIDASKREEYVDLVVAAQAKIEDSYIDDWRHKLKFAQQLKDFSTLIQYKQLNKHFVPKFFDYCLDDVAEVRNTVVRATAHVLMNAAETGDELELDLLLDQMSYFKESPSYSHRQTFVLMMESVIQDGLQRSKSNLVKAVITNKFKADIAKLSKDPVDNVRLVLAEVLAGVYATCTEATDEAVQARGQIIIENELLLPLCNLKKDPCQLIRDQVECFSLGVEAFTAASEDEQRAGGTMEVESNHP